MEEQEIWLPIPGYGGLYMVSSLGRIKRLESMVKHPLGGYRKVVERILKNEGNNKYIQYMLCFEGSRDGHLLHRLVATAFHPNPDNKPCVNHKDGNTHNNAAYNLEWATYSENELHSTRTLKKRTHIENLRNYDSEWQTVLSVNGYNIRGAARKKAYELLKAGMTVDDLPAHNIPLSSFQKLVCFLRKHKVNIQTTEQPNTKKLKYIIV